jgi:C1A family cysteine protease
MKLAVVALIALVAAPALATPMTEDNYDFLFRAWRTQFGKTYSTPEEAHLRYNIFKANLDKVTAHNAKSEPWTMAMNEFGDLTPTEFAAGRIGGYVPRNLRRAAPAGNLAVAKVDAADLPSSVDWTTKGAVTGVKNQGQCGSCWSFSTTGSVEGIGAISGKGLVSLSEQMLVDCSGNYGNQGCNGGLMDDAFKYIINKGGLCSEAAYPYHASDGQCQASSCQLQPSSAITGYHDVTQDDMSALQTAAAQQPVSVAIEADQTSFQLYHGGVFTASCGTRLDHGVLVVGYGSDNGQDYWKVKNSWGASWGEAGYIRMGRGSSFGSSGQCGIQMQPSYPTM